MEAKKQIWEKTILLGEYENDESEFGTDSNILKPISAKTMKTKHDGFYESDGKTRIKNIDDLEIGSEVLRRWPYNGALYNCRVMKCILSNNSAIDQKARKKSEANSEELKEIKHKYGEATKQIANVVMELDKSREELKSAEQSIKQLKHSAKILQDKNDELVASLEHSRTTCKIIAAQRDQLETVLRIDENSNLKILNKLNNEQPMVKQEQGRKQGTKSSKEEHKRALKIKLQNLVKALENRQTFRPTTTNTISINTNNNEHATGNNELATANSLEEEPFDECYEKLKLGYLILEVQNIQDSVQERRSLVENMAKKCFMKQLDLVSRKSREKSRLGQIKFYPNQANSNLTRQKVAQIQNSSKSKPNGKRQEYNSPNTTLKLNKYLTPKKRKKSATPDSIAGDSGLILKRNKIDDVLPEHNTNNTIAEISLNKQISETCLSKEVGFEEHIKHILATPNYEIVKNAMQELSQQTPKVKQLPSLMKIVSTCIEVCEGNIPSLQEFDIKPCRMSRLQTMAKKILLRALSKNSLFTKLSVTPRGALKLMIFCCTMIRTAEHRAIGYLWMSHVVEKASAWDSDDLEMFAMAIEDEARGGLKLDLALVLGILLTTLGSLSNFLTDSRIRRKNIKSNIPLTKTHFISSACLVTLLLWETENERREKAISILSELRPEFDVSNSKSFELMAIAVEELVHSDMRSEIHSDMHADIQNCETLDDISVSISSFYQTIALEYFLKDIHKW